MTGNKHYLRITIAISILIIITLWSYRLYDQNHQIPEIPTFNPASLSKDGSQHQEITIEFDDETFIRGITHRHTQKKDKLSSFEDSLGGGVCVADFNNDGWDDIFFIAGSGNRRHFGKQYWWQTPIPNQLYINQSGQYFFNSTASSGIKESSFGIACAVSDLNKDGYIDLIVANKGENFVYQNIDGLTFKQVTTPFDKEGKLFSTSILVFDFNRDGYDDILFGNYVNFSQEQNVLELNAGFDSQKITNFESALYDAQPDTLYLNKGDFSFEYNEKFTKPNKHGRTLSFFENGSVLALNDKGSPSELVYSDGVESRIESIVLNARDAKLINTPSEKPHQILVASDSNKGGLFAITMGDQLNDVSWDYGINDENRPYSTWAVLKGDFNLDSHEDIFLSNGLMQPNPDTNQTPTGQPNIFLMANSSIGAFSTYSIKNERVLSSRGAATLDMNNDGKLDIIVNNNNDFPTLLVNKTSILNNWIGLRCYPDYLCKKISISIDGKLFSNQIKRDSNFGSMSGKLFITGLSGGATHNLSIKGSGFQFNKKIESHNQYYAININERSIEPILKTATIKQNQITDSEKEEFIALMRQGNSNMRFFELNSIIAIASTSEDQLVILDEIIHSKNKLGFSLAEKWSYTIDEEIALKSIEALRLMEAEEAVPSLLNLLNSGNANIRCAAARAFEYFYWKDEAVTERKHWAEPTLIQLIDSSDPQTSVCAIDAIAESESYRGVFPLLSILESDNYLVVARASRALGMIRQTESATSLADKLITSKSPFVKAEALLALLRLKADISNIDIKKLLSTQTDFFNIIFQQVLKISDDGVNATHLFENSRKVAHPIQQHLNNLNYIELFKLYSYLSTSSQQSSRSSGLELLYAAKDLKSDNDIKKLFLEKRPDLSNDSIFISIVKKLYSPKREVNTSIICGNQSSSVPKKNPFLESYTSNHIAESIRNCINAGYYKESISLADFYQHSNYYSVALNELLTSQKIQQQEKYYMLLNFPLSFHSLKTILLKMDSFSVAQQLSILRAIELKIQRPIYTDWLKEVAAKTDAPAIKFFIAGRTTPIQSDTYHE